MSKGYSFEDLARMRIVSDGTTTGTKIFDHKGNQIHGVQKITIEIDVEDPIPRAKLTFYTPCLELENVKTTGKETPVEPVYEIGSEGEPVMNIHVPKYGNKPS